MAEVGVMGPYQHSERLEPGESIWVQLGEADGYANCALSVTATAHDGEGGADHVLKVDNVNITTNKTHGGDISYLSYAAGCNVTNNGSTTVTSWSVLVGVVRP